MEKKRWESMAVLCSLFILFSSCGSGGGHSTPPPDGTTDGTTDAATEELAPPTCTDRDGDGYGVNCSRGGDCDDADPAKWDDCSDCPFRHEEGCPCAGGGESYSCYEGSTETAGVGPCKRGVRRCIGTQLGPCEGQVLPTVLEDCADGIDNNCNGLTDGDDFVCSDCAPPCYTEGLVEPSPEDPGSTGLVPSPDGEGVVLGSNEEDDTGSAWIANAGEGTVSKLDINTGAEVGRYRVGLTGTGADSPSRTAVDDYQNAYVACRAFEGQGSVTKMAGIERYCVDRNGNGVIDTSRNSTPMALGTDECVLWTAPVGVVNGVPRALAIDFGSYEGDIAGNSPWVGNYYEHRFYNLDPDDGHVVTQVDINVSSYGAAIDSQGWIWISGRGFSAIQRFHSTTLVVEAPISVPSSCGGSDPYGITIDLADRVWIGVLPGSGACRYDPATGTWLFVNLGGSGRGVAVDKDNNIWATNYDTFKLHFFRADDGGGLSTWDLVGASPAVGVGVDRNGKVWALAQGSNSVARFDPAAARFDSFPVGSGPYTYSDFLGYQRWLMMPYGLWIGMFERCNYKPGDKWGELRWNTETPSDSKITIKARSADTADGVLAAPEVILAEIGPDADVGSVDVEAAYSEAGTPLGVFIEITVFLQPSTDETPLSPVFRSIQAFYSCDNLG